YRLPHSRIARHESHGLEHLGTGIRHRHCAEQEASEEANGDTDVARPVSALVSRLAPGLSDPRGLHVARLRPPGVWRSAPWLDRHAAADLPARSDLLRRPRSSHCFARAYN